MLYENDQKEMREKLEKLDDAVNTMSRALGMDKATFYSTSTVANGTVKMGWNNSDPVSYTHLTLPTSDLV